MIAKDCRRNNDGGGDMVKPTENNPGRAIRVSSPLAEQVAAMAREEDRPISWVFERLLRAGIRAETGRPALTA